MDSSKETCKFSLGHSTAPRNSRCLLNDRKKVRNFKQIITNETKQNKSYTTVRKKDRNNNYTSNINIKKNYLAMYGFSATRMVRKVN